jgi:glutamate/tyrosine decarboxylase-like PLP-dependent enzyme
VANAGTTNTGAVDPLNAIADVCARETLWMHVDGAYGAASVVSERGRAALGGLARADSVTIDPHKWFFQPYELGCLLIKDVSVLRRAFRVEEDDHADYLADVMRHVKEEVNFFGQGIELTRSFKALKLWLSLRAFGLAEFRRAINVGFEMAEHAERRLREDPRWEIVTPAQMGIVTFRWRDASRSPEELDRVIEQVADSMRADGYALVFSTSLRKRNTLRLCPIHPGTNAAEIDETIRRLTRFAVEAGT